MDRTSPYDLLDHGKAARTREAVRRAPSGAGVDVPARVRFGWHKVANPNLVNGVGLPASPFHTDGWRGGTGE